MTQPQESPVQLQVDTVAPAPGSSSTGGGVRTIVMTVPVNGVPTQVQVQVVAMTDGQGNIVDTFAPDRYEMAILQELRELRKLISSFLGVAPVFEPLYMQENDPNTLG